MKIHNYNPNPKGSTSAGDCVVRMLTKALGDIDWETAFCILIVRAFSMSTMPSANNVWASILLDNGYEEFSMMSRCRDCYTFKDFCEDHKDDKQYVLCSGSHTCYYHRNQLWDSWDSLNEPLLYYFSRNLDLISGE